eukprot:scaffold2425_cov76-Skeletonema_dohrnii-CCMP3373.AAC.23
MDIEAKVTVKLRIGIQPRAAEATTNESEMYIRHHGGPPSNKKAIFARLRTRARERYNRSLG